MGVGAAGRWATVVMGLLPGAASAQSVNPFNGTVERNATSAASAANARIYGAVGFLENVLLPTMKTSPDGWTIGAESNSVQGVAHAPAESDGACSTTLFGDGPDSCPYTRVDIDTFSSTGGWGYRTGAFSLFYSAGWTGSRLTEPGVEFAYPFWVGSLAGMGFFNTYSAPFQTGPLKLYDGFGALVEDSQQAYIVGAATELFGVEGRVGFVASDEGNGLFLSGAERSINFGASAVLQKELGDLPYAKFGLDKSPIVGSLLGFEGETPLLTSIYARRLFLPATSLAEGADPVGQVQWSGHLEQHNLPIGAGNYMLADVALSLAAAPAVRFQHVNVSFHPGKIQAGELDIEAGARFSIGYVRHPEMRFYGLDGGGALSWGLELYSPYFTFSISRNDPDMLAKFPQAHNAMNILLRFAVPAWWEDESGDVEDDA